MSAPVVAVFGSSNSVPGDGHYEEGVNCGRLLAAAGFGVATGGYGGLMEAVSAGARRAGGHVIGVTAPAVFPGRDQANPHVAEERAATTLTERIHEITNMAAASIVLHGSIGTATELMVAWNLAYVAQFSGRHAKPVVTVGQQWRELVADLTAILETDGSLVTCADSVEDAVAAVEQALAAN